MPAPTDADHRLTSDGGPRYTESPRDPLAADAPSVAEPWNTVTASFFIVLVVAWLWRLRGRFRNFPFMTACLPILSIGAVAGTLYHATRTRWIYFFLDWFPITLLGAAASIYLAVRLGRWYGLMRVMLTMIGLMAFYVAVNWFLFGMLAESFPAVPNLRVNLSYAALAILIMIPLTFLMIRTRFRRAGLIVGGLAAFGIAWICRLVDPQSTLPMGTHWLWHTFGAIATALLFEYFYKLEGGKI